MRIKQLAELGRFAEVERAIIEEGWSEVPAQLTNNILASMNRDVLNQLALASSIQHAGENGRAREQIIAAYLRRLVPKDFGVETGFVIDAVGGISRQIDIVIYRAGYHPVFEIGGIKHFMIESVAAVFENKASISSVSALQTALENIRSVKALDRTNRGRNYLLRLPERPLDPNEFQNQVFGAVVTEKSLSRDNFKDEWLSFLHENPKRLWPNFYADVRAFSAFYLKQIEPAVATVVPNDAQALAVTDSSDEGQAPPLLALTFELLNFLRIAAQIDYKPTDYLDIGSGKLNWYKL